MAPGAIAWRVLLSRTGLGWLFQLSTVWRLRRWRDECFSGARAEYGGYSGCSSHSLGAALRQRVHEIGLSFQLSSVRRLRREAAGALLAQSTLSLYGCARLGARTVPCQTPQNTLQ